MPLSEIPIAASRNHLGLGPRCPRHWRHDNGPDAPFPDRDRYRRDLHRYRFCRCRQRRHARHQGVEHACQPGHRPRARGRRDPQSRRRRPGRRARPCPWHDGRHQRAAAGRDPLARPDRHRRLPPYPGDRPPVGARRLRQFLFLGEAGTPGAAPSRARSRRPAELQGRRVARRSTKRACARRRVSSSAIRYRRSASASCIPMPTTPTSAASPRSSRRNTRKRRCRFPAPCCRNTANTSAR